MNKDQLISALEKLPETGEVEVCALQPGDVLVLKVPGPIPQSTAEQLKEYLQIIWPENKVLVLGDGLDLKIVRAESDFLNNFTIDMPENVSEETIQRIVSQLKEKL